MEPFRRISTRTWEPITRPGPPEGRPRNRPGSIRRRVRRRSLKSDSRRWNLGGPATKRAEAKGIADHQEGFGLTRSLISAFMMGDGQFCTRVVAGHSSQKHSRPLFGPPLIAKDPARAGPDTELQWCARSTLKKVVSRVVVLVRKT